MPARMSRRNLLALSAAAPFAFAARSARGADPVPAQRPPEMATIGIAAGQLARVSVFHHSDASFPDAPDIFRVDFLGVDGKLVATGTGMVTPGQGAFLDFDLAANLKKGERLQVHCNVTVPQGHQDHIGSTLELFDEKTGEMAGAMNPCQIPLSSAPVEMGTVGVVSGQIARLSLFHHSDPQFPEGPDIFKIEIYGLDGKLLGSNSGSLMPGQGAFFDYNLAATSRKGERVQFHAMVHLREGHHVGSVIEIFDEKTGRLAGAMNPCQILVKPQ